ncbi:MAG: DUF975 family protein [Eubacterium sp.]|nr:DUF975 family protein [Eubacterium sp.]
MWDRISIKQKANRALSDSYWKNVLAALIMAIVTGTVSFHTSGRDLDDYGWGRSLVNTISPVQWFAVVTTIATVSVVVVIVIIIFDVFVFNPLEVGGRKYFIGALRGHHEIGSFGFVFDNCYINVVKTMFFRDLFTFLWSLLFVIPGIVKSYEYRMIPYIMAENPSLSTEEVFGLSRQMMNGNKWNVFVFDLSFIGWALLSIITFGIVQLFYTGPYYELACAELYEQISYDFKDGEETETKKEVNW